MDRNQATGLILMLVLMTAYFYFFVPQEEIPPPQTEATKTSTTAKPITSRTSNGTLSQASSTGQDSLALAIQKERYGLFAPFAQGKAQDIVLENEVMKVTLSSRGAGVKQVILKKYRAYDKKPLVLLDSSSSHMEMLLFSNYKPINLAELYYQVDPTALSVSEEDSLTIRLTLALDSTRYIEQKYQLGGTGYQLQYEINLVGMEGIIDPQAAQFTWRAHMRKLEHAMEESRAKATVNYLTSEGAFDYLGHSESETSETFHQGLKWFAFKQRFFVAALISEGTFSQATLSSYINPKDTSTVRTARAKLHLPIEDLTSGKGKYQYFFGPNDYTIEKRVTPGFEQNVELGWFLFRFINEYLIIPIFNLLQQFIANYGIIIIILVFIIKMILVPLTYKSYLSMAKMKVVKPEMDEIRKKHEGDQQKTQQATMDLYRKVGINPLSGCIPMLLQFPFLLAMFYFFPNSIELRQQSFLWAKDLSTYDSILSLPFTIPFYGDHVSLFCLLMTASSVVLTWSNSQMNSQMQGPMKTMQYIMPIMFMFFLNNFSSGLTLYYFVSNLVTFGQMSAFRKLINEEKIKKALEENRKKNANKKKSKFQLKLEEAMKASEENKKKKKNKR